MMKRRYVPQLLLGNLAVSAVIAILCFWGNQAVNTASESVSLTQRCIVIIDAGHGGVDGGATSCSGVLESNLNLEIALRLEDLFTCWESLRK